MAHATSRQEIAALRALVERDLRDSLSHDVSADWRLNIAYNAALQAAKMALAASGYRPAKGGNSHYYTIQSLSLTIGLDAASIRKLEVFRKRRNTTEYDQAGVSSDRDAKEMHGLATTVRDAVISWLEASHPELLNE